MTPKSDSEVAAIIAAQENELNGVISVVEMAAKRLQELRAENEILKRTVYRVLMGVEGDFTHTQLREYESGRLKWVGGQAKWVRNT